MIIVRQTLQYLTDQVDAALDAPVPIAIGVIVAALVVWRLVEWRYGKVIGRLRKSVERKESMIRLLQGRGASATTPIEPVSADAAEADGIPSEDARDRQKALRKIVNAIDAARMARQSGDPQETEKAMPAMGLGLLTARNAFDVQVPTASGSATVDLDVGRQLLELVRPALLLGHDEEARRLADAFLRRAAAA